MPNNIADKIKKAPIALNSRFDALVKKKSITNVLIQL